MRIVKIIIRSILYPFELCADILCEFYDWIYED